MQGTMQVECFCAVSFLLVVQCGSARPSPIKRVGLGTRRMGTRGQNLWAVQVNIQLSVLLPQILHTCLCSASLVLLFRHLEPTRTLLVLDCYRNNYAFCKDLRLTR